VDLYLKARLSPILKCFKQRNLLAGATMGGKSDIAKIILSKEYVDTKYSSGKLKE
jgi:hypothetical protein